MKGCVYQIRKSICFLLMLAMLLSLAGCIKPLPGTEPTRNTEGSVTTSPSTQPATQPTTMPAVPTEPSAVPTQPAEPEADPNALVYELTQEDVDEFYRLLQECENISLVGEDMDGIEASVAMVDEQYALLNAQCSIAMILHFSDTSNKQMEEQYLQCVDICADANNEYIQMVRRIYQSDSPAKEKLFEDWSQQDIAQLLSYEEEVTLLQKRNAEIEVQYRAATTDSVRIPLYIELVENNNRIAQIYGYDNFYTYSYDLICNRDYSAQELEQMRRYARDYLVDTMDIALNNFINSYHSLSPSKQYNMEVLLYADYDSLVTNYVERYINRLPESMQEHMKTMLAADSLFATSPKARAGAFTTVIGDRSYCFFGPGYAGSYTVVHEAGHYYASRYADLAAIPLDLAETHSQGNEWLFMRSLMGQIPMDQYEAIVNYRLSNEIAMILICLMVDEFEQRVYTTDLTGFTAADLDAIMDEVCQNYCSLEYAAEMLTDLHYYWRAVVVDQPVYYISYAVSSVASIALYTMAVEDFDGAMAVYQSLCEQPKEEQGFLGNITAAGLNSPFQEEFYIQFVEMINGRT